MKRILLTSLLAFSLAACGFQLRSHATLPFAVMRVAAPGDSPLATELRRALRVNNVRVIAEGEPIKDAEATLHLISAINEKFILSLSAGGKVREFQLRSRIAFRVTDAKGSELIPSSEIALKRDFSFSDTQTLAKEAEEALLYRDMQNDAVQQILRRLAAVKPAPQ